MGCGLSVADFRPYFTFDGVIYNDTEWLVEY